MSLAFFKIQTAVSKFQKWIVCIIPYRMSSRSNFMDCWHFIQCNSIKSRVLFCCVEDGELNKYVLVVDGRSNEICYPQSLWKRSICHASTPRWTNAQICYRIPFMCDFLFLFLYCAQKTTSFHLLFPIQLKIFIWLRSIKLFTKV